MTQTMTNKELQHYWAFQEMCNMKTQYDKIFTYGRTGDHICVFFTGQEVIIAVDATDFDEGVEEWKSNFDFSPPINGFHRGFYTTAKYFYTEHIQTLVTYLRGVGAENIPITIIGHSRGGGIAPILNYFLNRDGFSNIKTVTFCQPKSGTIKGIRAMKKIGVEVHRVEAKLDFVDNVPPIITFKPFCIWKQYQTKHYQLPSVRGIDHAEVGRAIKELIDG